MAMAPQQAFYQYIIQSTMNLAVLLGNLEHQLLFFDNLLIVAFGSHDIIRLIRAADELQNRRAAFKIRVEVGFQYVHPELLPKMSILMSKVMTPELTLMDAPNHLITVDIQSELPNNCLEEAKSVLLQGKILCFYAAENSIPYLISLFTTLREYDMAGRISIWTSTDILTKQAQLHIIMQGVIRPPSSTEPQSAPAADAAHADAENAIFAAQGQQPS